MRPSVRNCVTLGVALSFPILKLYPVWDRIHFLLLPDQDVDHSAPFQAPYLPATMCLAFTIMDQSSETVSLPQLIVSLYKTCHGCGSLHKNRNPKTSRNLIPEKIKYKQEKYMLTHI